MTIGLAILLGAMLGAPIGFFAACLCWMGKGS